MKMEIPRGFQVVEMIRAPFNQQIVNIKRYQKEAKIEYNGPHITIVEDNHGIIREFSKLITKNNFMLPNDNKARLIAERTIDKYDPQRLLKLTFIEIEDQVRYFWSKDGQKNEVPILWVKYGDSDGAFSWVGIAGKGEVVEYERQAYYDYVNGKGKTEQWTNDNWLLGHKNLFLNQK